MSYNRLHLNGIYLNFPKDMYFSLVIGYPKR